MERVEELGWKAYRRGMFNEWINLRSEYIKEQDLEIEEAAEQAYRAIKKGLITSI